MNFKINIISKYRKKENYLKNTIDSMNEKCTIFLSDFKEDTPYNDYINNNKIHFYTEKKGFENHINKLKSVPINYAYNFQRAFEYHNNEDYIYILEDDLDFTENWLQKSKNIIEHINIKYGKNFILNLYSPYDVNSKSLYEIYDIKNNYTKHYGCQAIIWPNHILKDFAKFNKTINLNDFRIKEDNIIFQIDHLISLYAEYKNIPLLTSCPSLVQHVGFKTSGVAEFMHQSPSFIK